ncbi:hypothetical protein ONZ45_g1410 [Pleurotus djamor]|nr:hypothetical protein ONZ45_g1410 [Pleurotus djamor]
MASILRAYNSALLRKPMLAQCLTGAVLFGAGDVIAQQAVERRGLSGHDFLARIKFASPTRGVLYRVWLDQAILTPASVPFFFGAMSILEGKAHDAIPRIRSAYIPTLLRNWAVFLPTQIINFAIVPPHLRFFVVSVVGLFWNTYLSVANAKEHARLHIETVTPVLPVLDDESSPV